MKNIIKYFVLVILLLNLTLLTNCKSNDSMINKETVKEVDLEKYIGTWYEIARYPHSFEKGLVGVTATYSFRKDGKIKVVNKGFKNSLNGEEDIAIGKAKVPDYNDKAKLKVSFFWIFYGDYYIMELDDDYQWAVIGSSSDKYLWILSRTPKMEESVYNMLIQRIEKRGYNLDKLIKVEQADK